MVARARRRQIGSENGSGESQARCWALYIGGGWLNEVATVMKRPVELVHFQSRRFWGGETRSRCFHLGEEGEQPEWLFCYCEEEVRSGCLAVVAHDLEDGGDAPLVPWRKTRGGQACWAKSQTRLGQNGWSQLGWHGIGKGKWGGLLPLFGPKDKNKKETKFWICGSWNGGCQMKYWIWMKVFEPSQIYKFGQC
jgi:hypothetical protein